MQRSGRAEPELSGAIEALGVLHTTVRDNRALALCVLRQLALPGVPAALAAGEGVERWASAQMSSVEAGLREAHRLAVGMGPGGEEVMAVLAECAARCVAVWRVLEDERPGARSAPEVDREGRARAERDVELERGARRKVTNKCKILPVMSRDVTPDKEQGNKIVHAVVFWAIRKINVTPDHCPLILWLVWARRCSMISRVGGRGDED